MLTEHFRNALPILEKLEENNFQAYFVGGCVRDLLLNKPIKDIDIATSATPREVQKIFSKVIPVGIEHGTVIVRHGKVSYEVTTFRIDGEYSNNRHPDTVKFIRNIKQDLERRDFTINALAMDKDGALTDLFNGQQDIADKIIQTVGNGVQRFEEDALRIIRALRFSSQLGFKIKPDTISDMISCKKAIEHLSVERITNEMEKFFAGNYVRKGMEYLLQTEIHLNLPIFKDEPALLEKTTEKIIPLYSFAEVITLFHYLQPNISISTWTRAWKCSNRTKRIATELYEHLLYFKKNKLDNMLVYRMPNEQFGAFIRLVHLLLNHQVSYEQLISLKKKLPIQSREDLAVNGNSLLQFFPDHKQGAWIRLLLNKIEENVVNGTLSNNDYDIKEWLKWNPPETN